MFIVLFEVKPHTPQMQRYLEFGKLLRPELEQIRGFIDNERFAHINQPEHILSLSTWSDEKALIRWRTHAQHHTVQEQGRSLVFADYRLRVAEVLSDTYPPQGHTIRRQRFDETEASSIKIISLVEIEPTIGDAVDPALLQALVIDQHNPPDGWLESAHYTSLYHPGKQILLVGWSTIETAQTWLTTHLTSQGNCSLRSRLVQVIRAYAMRERAEAPQYYPDAPSPVIW